MTKILGAARFAGVALAAGALTLVGASSASAATLPPTYYPVGPQTSVNQSALVGWTLCYSGLYADDDVALYGAGGIISELCTGDYLMLAGGPLNDPILTVLAAAPRADVLTDTGTDFTTTQNANGSEWYFNPNHSWGFALGGDIVRKNSCDTDDTNAESRLCFHTGDGLADHMSAGYRAGATEGLNFATDWTRYVYQASGTTTPAAVLPVMGSDSSVPLLAAASLLAVGLAVVTTTSLRARRTRHA